MSEVVENAKTEYDRVHTRFVNALKATPEDKQNWSPSASCRTPVQLAVHGAQATEFITKMLQGEPMPPMNDLKAVDAGMRAGEHGFTAEKAFELLENSRAGYIAFLDSLTDDQIGSTINTPFGPQTLGKSLIFPCRHLQDHVAQLDYIQTIYGDHEWRF